MNDREAVVEALIATLHRMHRGKHARIACGWGYHDGVSDCAAFARAILEAEPRLTLADPVDGQTIADELSQRYQDGYAQGMNAALDTD